MDKDLELVIKEYITSVNSVCNIVLKELKLNTKFDFLEYKAKHRQMELEVNGMRFIFHGRGCIATNDELFLDWDFGYGSRWCGINPWLLAETLEHGTKQYVKPYSAKQIEQACEEAVLKNEMYIKYDLYYFKIPISDTFEPDFPKEFDVFVIEHYGLKWKIPRNKVIDKFLRKSKRIWKGHEKGADLYTLSFLKDDKEIYSILYDDISYPENAVKVMKEILINICKIKVFW